jgi:LmbE family N-acetylglucosaminyl deacetylase
MELVVDEQRLGTTEDAWRDSPRLRELAALEELDPRRVIVVAPHPDDEVFGAGGLLRHLSTRNIPIEILAVSDGEGSHPLAVEQGLDLRSQRTAESARALRRLVPHAPRVTRLGLPDGRIGRHRDRLTDALGSFLRPGDLCLAPWWRDGHPDHDACGQAAIAAAGAVQADLLGYLVWTWHWAHPDGEDVPWEDCRRFDFDRRTGAHKRWATRAFVSQTRPLGPDHHDSPLLPPPVVRRFWRTYEVFVTTPSEQR